MGGLSGIGEESSESTRQSVANMFSLFEGLLEEFYLLERENISQTSEPKFVHYTKTNFPLRRLSE